MRGLSTKERLRECPMLKVTSRKYLQFIVSSNFWLTSGGYPLSAMHKTSPVSFFRTSTKVNTLPEKYLPGMQKTVKKVYFDHVF